jgi:hypothetical protein
MMSPRLFAALLGIFVVAPSVAATDWSSAIPTFTRPIGAPAHIVWSARIQPGQAGEFQLYRVRGGEPREVARFAGEAGVHGYRWVDRGAVDANALYELRWASVDGKTIVLGRLHCQRESTCEPLASPATHSVRALELTPTDTPRLSTGPAERPAWLLARRARRAGAAPADPPPWQAESPAR